MASQESNFDAEAAALNANGRTLSTGDWFLRFKHLLLICTVLLLQTALVYIQLPFIKTTWFARQHFPAGDPASLNCNDTPTLPACQQGAAELAYWTGILSGVSGVAAIFSAITLGALSDAIGRRKVIIFGVAISMCVKFALVAVVYFDVSLWTFLYMETLEDSFDTNGVWFAIVADLTQDQKGKRGPVFGSAIVACVAIVCVFLPVSALLSYTQAVAVAALLSVFLLFLVVFVLPETKPPVSGTGQEGLRALPGELRSALAILNRNVFMKRMVAVLVLGGVAYAGKLTIMSPYMMAHFGLNKKSFATLIPVAAPSIAVCFTFGLWKAVPYFGEVPVLQASFFANALLTLGIICSSSTWQIFAIYGLLTGPGLMFVPLINAIKSNLCSDQEQGKIQGLVAAIRGFAVSFADVVFGSLYEWTTDNGKNTEAAASCLWLVVAFTVAAATLTLTLPATYEEKYTRRVMEENVSTEVEMPEPQLTQY